MSRACGRGDVGEIEHSVVTSTPVHLNVEAIDDCEDFDIIDSREPPRTKKRFRRRAIPHSIANECSERCAAKPIVLEEVIGILASKRAALEREVNRVEAVAGRPGVKDRPERALCRARARVAEILDESRQVDIPGAAAEKTSQLGGKVPMKATGREPDVQEAGVQLAPNAGVPQQHGTPSDDESSFHGCEIVSGVRVPRRVGELATRKPAQIWQCCARVWAIGCPQ